MHYVIRLSTTPKQTVKIWTEMELLENGKNLIEGGKKVEKNWSACGC